MDDESGTGMTAASRARLIGAGYAAQGLGYAAVVTALPAFKDRQGIDDTFVSAILLLVCVAAAGGSMLADRIATRWGSRYALASGLLLVSAGLAGATLATPNAVFTAILLAYGVGLGAVDASLSMQGVLVQARLGRSVMSRLFAAYTAAAIAAALLMSGVLESGAGAELAVGVAAVFAALIGVIGWRLFEPGRTLRSAAVHPHGGRAIRPIVLVCGMLIFTAFLVDSAVSTWSSVYLHDSLAAASSVAPLGYAAYQAAVLVSRLVADHVMPRAGRLMVAVGGLAVCGIGCGLVALLPSVGAAVTGFAISGIGVGVLVPLAFSAAGEAAAENSDEVIAKVNLFNYGGALVGAVLFGALSEPIGLQIAFLIPVVAVVLTLPLARRLNHLTIAAPAAKPAG
ncbi:putative MFS transporter [Actinoplanes missouriensis 431]|uniref:Putative MFS transporter n=1 Tax=Actinoplanes missouriensis (strain ATCC 14538 / DSM 43046 / CBS 188.64 / JCM 3121 / NBRC 102363 / NCIMB 12654 / NRRL B-3342 / UNCC 431) TaxID=512565 RepID=I0GXW0_ACTM4|nr:MFS transporter [Actinoplanes missouriensis]BAL85597.1 putative MFS transporter [Actinoplanes missouriensis 431]